MEMSDYLKCVRGETAHEPLCMFLAGDQCYTFIRIMARLLLLKSMAPQYLFFMFLQAPNRLCTESIWGDDRLLNT